MHPTQCGKAATPSRHGFDPKLSTPHISGLETTSHSILIIPNSRDSRFAKQQVIGAQLRPDRDRSAAWDPVRGGQPNRYHGMLVADRIRDCAA
jgi:hypothetical protein